MALLELCASSIPNAKRWEQNGDASVASALTTFGQVSGVPLKDAMPWYHTKLEAEKAVRDLAANCTGASLDVSTRSDKGDRNGTEVHMDVLRLTRGPSGDKAKAMLVFGEHAREVITVESGLHLLGSLCGQGDFSSRASTVLDSMSFVIILMANPSGRVEVDQGLLCKRTNGNGVDLNRNWGDIHRDGHLAGSGEQDYPGPGGFSEPETRMMRDIIETEKPDLFLSVHSGAYLLSMPYGYMPGPRPTNADAMAEALQSISKMPAISDCPYGPLAEILGYNSHSCDIDYVADIAAVPYSFNWEIYTGPEDRFAFIEVGDCRNRALERRGPTQHCALKQLRHSRVSAIEPSSPRRLRGLGGTLSLGYHDEVWGGNLPDNMCRVSDFNPITERETRHVLNKWTPAYLEIAETVARRLRGGEGRGT